MGLGSLFIIGVAVFLLRGYIEDLRTKRVGAVFSFITFEEHEGEVMGFKFATHQYKIIIDDPLEVHYWAHFCAPRDSKYWF